MKEQDERIERLLECYFDARTTEAEERELRDYFRYVDEIPASLRYARTMFGGLDALAEERYPGEGSVQTGPAVRPAEGMRRYETRSAAGRGARGGRKLRPLWGVAAAAAVVLGVFSMPNICASPIAISTVWRFTTRRLPCRRRFTCRDSRISAIRSAWWMN